MGFTKLDEGILQSSIMAEDSDTFKVWISLLASCESNGISKVSAVFLSSVCRLSLPKTIECIEKLEKPDSLSRSTNDEGRRIRRVDGGYEVINYKKYREYSYSDSPDAIRQRKHRDKCDMSQNVTKSCDISASASASVLSLSSSSLKSAEKLSSCIPPKVEWVKEYCEKRKNGIDPGAFMDHYISNGWMVGKTKMKDWQSAVRTWERNKIKMVNGQRYGRGEVSGNFKEKLNNINLEGEGRKEIE